MHVLLDDAPAVVADLIGDLIQGWEIDPPLAQIDEGAGARALAGRFDLHADLSAKVLSRGGAGAQHEDHNTLKELARQRCCLYDFLPPKTKSFADPAFRWQLAHLPDAAGGVI